MRKLIQIVAVVVMMWAGYEIVKWFMSYKQVEYDLQEAQQQEFTAFQKEYPNTVGWLTLEGTRINNPVMQATDNTFFLTHNYKGEKSRGGSIFMDYRNEPGLTDRHTIFYGHVLRNETMFGSLVKFSDEAYAKEHRIFTYYNNKEVIELEVFSAYETTTDFYYIDTEFAKGEFDSFIKTIQQKSAVQMSVDVTATDQIITFSTCTTSTNDKERFVVHAKVINRGEMDYEI